MRFLIKPIVFLIKNTSSGFSFIFVGVGGGGVGVAVGGRGGRES